MMTVANGNPDDAEVSSQTSYSLASFILHPSPSSFNHSSVFHQNDSIGKTGGQLAIVRNHQYR